MSPSLKPLAPSTNASSVNTLVSLPSEVSQIRKVSYKLR
ncbi:hypothetical protein KP77_29250 [Jeotgalibacillus alimentarius]|uniref:Uncharacterized protein n=1 Tax=Jeotgalibacillus alimentarius TaxID=135826 RepID=A0A0C2VHL1_9BACL|nr:hypothetical protein KP77_29250 [Jeotgalibacillus alimentarius]